MSRVNSLAVIILTYNESLHLARALKSVCQCATEIHVVDSFSTDGTIEIAREYGAKVHQNPFINHAVQVQWALDNCDIQTDWVMRLDADEYLTDELIEELNTGLGGIPEEITGIVLKRQVHFMNKWIRHGGYYPVKLLRIWRRGMASVEQRMMDEHIVLSEGRTIEFNHDIVDANLNNLNWWTSKHNNYALREAIDVLNQKYGFFEGRDIEATLGSDDQASSKRWMKSNVYLKLPLFFRAFLYFNYRYWIKLGFLDGTRGLVWHFLQGLWYRFLVDAIIFNIEYRAEATGRKVREVIEDDYGYQIPIPEQLH